MIAGTRSSSFGYSEAAMPHPSVLLPGASGSMPVSLSPTMSPGNRPFRAPAIAGLDTFVRSVTRLKRLEHRDPVAVALGHLARLHEQIEMPEHFRERQV